MLAALLITLATSCEQTKGPAKTTENSSEGTPTPEGGEDAKADTEASAGADDEAPEAGGITLRSKTLPKAPERIVSLAPNLTEILFELGLGDRVVGVTRFCDYPPEAKGITKIGGYIDPDLEAIIAARPDLVIGMSGGASKKTAEMLDGASISYAMFKMATIDETVAGIDLVGETVGAKETAKKLSEKTRGALTGAKVDGARPKVLFVLGHKPIIVAGPGSFGHELIGLAGGVNAVADVKNPYPQLDREKIIALAPEIIIDANMGQSDAQRDAFWASFPSLPAVTAKRVATFDDPALLRPGPRLPNALETFRKVVAPPSPQP